MDIVKKKWKRFSCYFVNTTLKKALVIYILIAMITTFLCCLVAVSFFKNWKDIVNVINAEAAPEKAISHIGILNQVQIVVIVVLIIFAVVVVSHLYYKRKLEEPLRILRAEMDFLSRDDLGFDCSYVSDDEMGKICQGFNQMRLQLMENKKNLWELMESQRELNAAFAHDIRTPLTVMKGYIQILLKFYPEGQISDDKLVDTLKMIDHQVDRMECFSSTMKEIHTFEERETIRAEIAFGQLFTVLLNNARGLSTDKVTLEMKVTPSKLHETMETIICDHSLIQEVVDNLVANAIRFSRDKVRLELCLENDKLYIYVKDNGRGFSKDALLKGTRPYFSTEKEHFGLGLTISQMLCKKHGGNLELMNSMEGGAIVCAYFFVK